MFTSNHDENSWAGTEFERMGDAARVMALLTFTLPNGQPLVYTGQEMGFDHRFEFFEKDPVPAWKRNGFTDFYAALIRLRHENPALAAGERGGQAAYPLGERTPDGLMLFSRTAGGNEVTVAANLSAEEVAFDLPFEGLAPRVLHREGIHGRHPHRASRHGSGWSSHKTGDKGCGHAPGMRGNSAGNPPGTR